MELQVRSDVVYASLVGGPGVDSVSTVVLFEERGSDAYREVIDITLWKAREERA